MPRVVGTPLEQLDGVWVDAFLLPHLDVIDAIQRVDGHLSEILELLLYFVEVDVHAGIVLQHRRAQPIMFPGTGEPVLHDHPVAALEGHAGISTCTTSPHGYLYPVVDAQMTW